MTTKLSAATLPAITTAATPAYDRTTLTPGIVHFEAAKFHRAHQPAPADVNDWVLACHVQQPLHHAGLDFLVAPSDLCTSMHSHTVVYSSPNTHTQRSEDKPNR